VLGGDYQGLGIVRSLGRHGIPVCVVDDEASIARFSRYTTSRSRIGSLNDTRQTVADLLHIGRDKGLLGWVLFPTRDELVATLSQYRQELSAVFRVPTPDWQTVKWLWDKRNTYSLAEKLGIPIPRTWYPRNIEDLAQVDGHFPVALKPAIKEHFIYATKAKAWLADDAETLRRLFEKARRLIPAEEIMIQDFIPGETGSQFAYCSLFANGKSIAGMTVCRCRQHPLDFGRSSTYVETVDLPLLEDYSRRFLSAADYSGLVEVEFKRDDRDGQFRLLDVNGRTWGYHSIGRSAGVDFPYLLFRQQVSQPVASCTGKTGVCWVRLLTDLPTGIVGMFKGKLNGRSYLKSLSRCNEEAVFSVQDPLPGLVEIALVPYLAVKRGF
jgi:D-aspartate ligase